jgi:hypothetical protein
MKKDARISVIVSRSTKHLLERHIRATGVNNDRLVEQAILHHLQAFHELTSQAVIHPALVVTPKSGTSILEQIRSGESTKALRDLMRDGD